MVSSIISTSKSRHTKKIEEEKETKSDSHKNHKKKKHADQQGNIYTTICITIFIFRGEPDVYYKRHVLIYFTSPELPEFHETVHVQRDTDESPWIVNRIHREMDWTLTRSYRAHVNAGALLVYSGQEMTPVNIVASVPTMGRDEDWNCQNFLLEGLQGLVNYGFQTQEWYAFVENEVMNEIIDGAVG